MDKSQLCDLISSAKQEDMKMYFITRLQKENTNARTPFNEKYLFKIYQIQITSEVRSYLYKLSVNQFEKISQNEELTFLEYDVIDDDTNHLFTYSMKNKVHSFADMISEQLKNSPPKITNLHEILSDESLWAYSIEFQIDPNESFYTFRKIAPSKVGIDEKEDQSKNLAQKVVRTVFNTNTNTLDLLKGETVNLDKQIDCIFFEDTFYDLRKYSFEELVGLQAEYTNKAFEISKRMDTLACFGDTKLLNENIAKKPQLNRRLIKLEKLGNLQNLDERSIRKLVRLGKKNKSEINVKEGKILFESESDIENTVKLLCDFFKTGEYSGKTYGTYAGRIQS